MSEASVFTIWGSDRSPYMTRVTLGPLRLHVFHRGDNDPDCHDHPADFWTFPLVSYLEEYVGPDGDLRRRIVKAFRLHRRRAEFAHRVICPADGEGQIATIVWWGRSRRPWGFRTAAGWLGWEEYVARRDPAPGASLTAKRRREVIENLRDEFDLLCLGMPSQHQIDAALRAAEGRP